MAGKRSPWGKPGSGDDGNGQSGSGDGSNGGGIGGEPGGGGDDAPRGPRNPWLPGGGSGDGDTPDRPRRSASIEDLFRNRGPEGPRRGGGSGGPGFRIPQRPGGKSWFPLAIAAIVLVWIGVSSIHFVQPREQGVVTWFGGKFSDTLDPGTNATMPWPIQMVDIENVSQIRSEEIPGDTNEKLILTSDQNLVDLSYLIRWNIKDLSLYRYQLADPNDTMREVAEATMRAAVAEHELDTVLTGAGRAEIEQQVLSNMQAILDAYRSGIAVQGIEINKTDPPARVEEAFKDVSSAQQDADAAMNRARADAQQWLNRAQGDAEEFIQIYDQYRLAPEVTRRRLYYETMESVLSGTDKTIVEADGVTPYLPLPELRRRTREAAATPPATGGQ
ncbi:hypothetical protein GCM10009127_09120 [Alteraurantiacibacter aestuarii]|uniref:Protease modulator HflK n=1 Tax=Alteraurantiacibacter aestuarii TaxID=650004 RepID=A0A844ZJU5_9SPHN|nr:protease modulator HflK [Alteraurantiacibacter aestuarii]MXO87300.1 protease modulator HflK [Alteraurantiacibacter aestuarii]